MFTDVPKTHWAYGDISLAASLGIVTGYPDGTFKPEQAATRAEVTVVALRTLGRAIIISGLVGVGTAFLVNKYIKGK